MLPLQNGDQERTAPPSCQISVAYSGSPRSGPDLRGLSPNSPSTNTLGKYESAGWFFAVQVQGNLFGDTNPSNWEPEQSATVSGRVRFWDVANLSQTTQVNIRRPSDSPLSGAVYRGDGMVNWIDTPGLRDPQPGGFVFSANLNYSFTSTLRHISGTTCSVNWSLRLSIVGERWNFTFRENVL